MMYPRLRLARNLLTDDGVIFISIDDSEQGNLKNMRWTKQQQQEALNNQKNPHSVRSRKGK